MLAAAIAPRPAAAATLTEDVKDLLSGPLLGRKRIIIQTNGAVSDLLVTTINLLGGRVYARFDCISGIAAEVPLTTLGKIVNLLGVECVSVDAPVDGAMDFTSMATGATAAREQSGLT